MSMLELRHVSKAYGDGAAQVRALDHVSVSVDAGALVAVMGPSGSGKSTLLTIAGTLEEPTSGEVLIGGTAVAKMSRAERARLRRRAIGYVFQDFNLLPGLTAAENVALPLELDGPRPGRRAPRGCGPWTAWAWPTARASTPTSCPAASGSGWRSPARWPASAADPGRRAVRRAGLGERGGGHAPAARREPAGPGRRGGDPRRAAGLVGRPGGIPARRARGRSQDAGPRCRVGSRPGTEPMSTALRDEPAAPARNGNGGVAARRAVMRWAWRMFRREWRQQLLALSLIVVAVAATFIGAAVATDTPPAANAGFGTAGDLAAFQAPDPHLAGQIAALRHRFGRVDVIENQAVAIPGSIQGYDLRAQDPRGPFGQPMLSLVSGQYPVGPGQVAVTQGRRIDLQPQGRGRLAPGRHRPPGDRHRPEPAEPGGRVRPGGAGPGHGADAGHRAVRRARGEAVLDRPQRSDPALGGAEQPAQPDDDRARPGHDRDAAHRAGRGGRLHGPGAAPAALARDARRPGRQRQAHPPGRAGQRRRGGRGRHGDRSRARADRLAGLPAGPGVRCAPRDRRVRAAVEGDPPSDGTGHHRLLFRRLAPGPPDHPHPHRDRPVRQARPPEAAAPHGRAGDRLPGRSVRPADLRRRQQQRRRIGRTRARPRRAGRGDDPAGTVLPDGAGQARQHTPIAARLALRDLARYRARSGSALAAISLGVLIAVLVCVESAARFGNVLDYAGPNLASNQIVVYTPNGPGGPGGPATDRVAR